jgi:hypothetical protein
MSERTCKTCNVASVALVFSVLHTCCCAKLQGWLTVVSAPPAPTFRGLAISFHCNGVKKMFHASEKLLVLHPTVSFSGTRGIGTQLSALKTGLASSKLDGVE